MTQPLKLTDAQLVLLSAAAVRDDYSVLPAPSSLTLNKGALWKVLNSLLKAGLIAERLAKLGEDVWRTEDDERFTLVLTEAGFKAIGIEADVDVINASSQQFMTSRPSPKPPSKHAALIDLMTEPRGATVPELMAATSWQAHSVRGAISGTVKKKLGLRVMSEHDLERGRVYRILDAKAAQ